MRDSDKYWSRDFERIVTPPQKREDWARVWEAIRAEYRSRRGDREGAIYTNHQGFLALNAVCHMLQQKPVMPLDGIGGVTMSIQMAVVAAQSLNREYTAWSGNARTNLYELRDVTAEAAADAVLKNRHGIAVIDTTSRSKDGSSPLWTEKYKRRHEATHVWQFTLNPSNKGLISEEKMLADPEYPALVEKLGNYYKDTTTLGDIFSEATAEAIAGAGWKAGLKTRTRTKEFLGRFFREVKRIYGKEALDLLHLVHPYVRVVLDQVRSESIHRDVLLSSDIRLREQSTIETASALKQMAAINPFDPNERRSWSELGADIVRMARETVKGLDPAKDGPDISALRQIAKMEPVNTGDKRLSWKDLTLAAVETARNADEAIKGANVEMNVGAAVAQEVHRDERAPAQSISL